MSDAPIPQLPSKLGGYEVVRRLGAGGMAEVFLAKKQGAEGTFKILVLKRILPAHGASRRFRSMFVEEAQLATRLLSQRVEIEVAAFPDDVAITVLPIGQQAGADFIFACHAANIAEGRPTGPPFEVIAAMPF